MAAIENWVWDTVFMYYVVTTWCNFAFCILCCSDIGIKHGGLYDITRHFATEKHKREAEKVKPVSLGSSIKSFFNNDDDLETIQAEAFCEFLVEHNISLSLRWPFVPNFQGQSPKQDLCPGLTYVPDFYFFDFITLFRIISTYEIFSKFDYTVRSIKWTSHAESSSSWRITTSLHFQYGRFGCLCGKQTTILSN